MKRWSSPLDKPVASLDSYSGRNVATLRFSNWLTGNTAPFCSFPADKYILNVAERKLH